MATVYGLLGASVSALYAFSPRLRREPALHAASVILFLVALHLVVLATSVELHELANVHLGAQFFLFLAASLCYVPALVCAGLEAWGFVCHKLLVPGGRSDRKKRASRRERVESVRSCLAILAKEPSNAAVREQLGDLYARLGFLDSAVYEYRKTSEWLQRGHAHATVLYKAAYLLAEKKKDLDAAAPLLRRIIRLYPKSYFAGYCRRVLNHYEAHRENKTSPGRDDARQKQGESEG